jgi:3-oxoacyl-[acyl-carrier-protein] synthase-3
MSLEAGAAAGVPLADIDLFVMHQANSRITAAVGRRLGIDDDRVVDCIENVGNLSGGSIPVALSLATQDGRLRDGSLVLLAAFGAGFTWGGTVVRWGVA